MKTQDKSGDIAANTSAPVSSKDAPVKVLVRITHNKTHALGGYFAKGAQVRMSKDEADALVKLGHATILGI